MQSVFVGRTAGSGQYLQLSGLQNCRQRAVFTVVLSTELQAAGSIYSCPDCRTAGSGHYLQLSGLQNCRQYLQLSCLQNCRQRAVFTVVRTAERPMQVRLVHKEVPQTRKEAAVTLSEVDMSGGTEKIHARPQSIQPTSPITSQERFISYCRVKALLLVTCKLL